MGQQIFQAVIPGDELEGGFLPDARHSGDVIAGIPRQGPHLHQFPGFQAIFLPDGRRVIAHLFHGIPHLHPVGHQGQEVLIPGDDLHRQALFPGPPHQGADEIIGFIPLVHQGGQIEGVDNLLYIGELAHQVPGHGRPVRLVVAIESVPEGGPFGVKDQGQMLGLPLPEHLEEHGGYP